MDTPSGQNVQKTNKRKSRIQAYRITRELPKEMFNKFYPSCPKSYREKIRKLRIERNLYAKDLAKKFKVSIHTILNWEKRGIIPCRTNRTKLHKLFPDLKDF
jgi:ribosome-binding protein aMBF1 (putative translation factor)